MKYRVGRCRAAGLTLLLAAMAAAAPAPSLRAEGGAPVAVGASTAVATEPRPYLDILDAVADRIEKDFYDAAKLRRLGWRERVAAYRSRVAAAADLSEAGGHINTLLDELGVSHTAFLTPADHAYYILLDLFGGPEAEDVAYWSAGVHHPGIGAFTAMEQGSHFIDQIMQGSPADRAGLKVGDEIVSVEGRPYAPITAFRDLMGKQATIEIRRIPGGPVVGVPVRVVPVAPIRAFELATEASARIIEREGRRIGYLQVWALKSASGFEAALGKLMPRLPPVLVQSEGFEHQQPAGRQSDRQSAARAPLHGLVIDMRGRIGGLSRTAVQMLSRLERPDDWIRFLSRGQVAGEGGLTQRPIVVLTDHHTRSAGELFVYGFKRARLGTVIGTRTAGAVLGSRLFSLPGGNQLMVAVSDVRVDGRSLEGIGVEPDVTIERPLAYSAGADPVLEAALAHVLGR